MPSIALFLIFGFVGDVMAKLVTISNLEPRRDTSGEIVAAHDGNIVQFTPSGDYHFYGMSYGNCKAQGCGRGSCGFQTTHNISLYTSPDLSQGSWDFQGHVLPVHDRPSGVYYRPKVIFNPSTGLFVLWVNWLSSRRDFGSSAYLVATAATPTGPFRVVEERVSTVFDTGGDFDIFVDDDGQAYLIYTSLAAKHHISIERLTPDFLSSTLNTTGILTGGGCLEAPTMFKRKGFYYALYGSCCCFCTAGDSRYAMRSTSPLGFSSGSQKYNLGNAGGAQENYVVQVATSHGTDYVWTGDRWNSGPDGMKDHDFQYWAPLSFNDSFSPSNGRFIKGSADAIYWEEGGVKYHVPSCHVCPNADPCGSWVAVTEEYVSSLVTGSDYTCDQVAGTPIFPVGQCDSFVLDMPVNATKSLV